MEKNKKRIIILIILILIQTSFVYSGVLQDLISDKDWDKMKSIFSDNSYLKLKTKFINSLEVDLVKIKAGKTKYYVKYSDHAEIGFIEFKKKSGIFCCLKIRENFPNLNFIKRFYKFPIDKKTIQIGNAKITFSNGNFFIADPMNTLVVFNGLIKVNIFPSDIEEQRTLIYLNKKSTFSISINKGIFILNEELMQSLFNGKIKNDLNISYKDKAFLDKHLVHINKDYGIDINGFNEYWFATFSQSLNLVYFIEKHSYYKYSYSPNRIPDTVLLNAKTGKYILSYNYKKGLKFLNSPNNKVRKIQLNMYLNPYKSRIWSSALLLYPEASNLRSFKISKNIHINDFIKMKGKNIDYIRQGENVFMLGDKFDNFSFFYSGKIPIKSQIAKIRSDRIYNKIEKTDDFFIYDTYNRFYPHPGDQFFETTLKISVPESLNCLASGFLKSKRTIYKRNEYVYKSDGTKGIAIVCGKFDKLLTIDLKIPLSFFGAERVDIKEIFNENEIKNILNFLNDMYKKRGIKSINIILRRGSKYSGTSYKGFVVFNIIKKNRNRVAVTSLSDKMYKTSPVYLTSSINRDNLVHELAHQWWGGIISWKTYRDVWITEGGAQFSSILYLESVLSKRNFNRIIKKLTKRVIRRSASAPVIYGNRIENITGDYQIYQNLIYNKSALVFFMLREMIGEKKLIKRINKIFSKFSKKSISTMEYINEICGDKENEAFLKQFFKKWIYSREIPVVDYKVSIVNNTASIAFEQKKTNFVFPLKMTIKTSGGNEVKKIIIKDKKQIVTIKTKDNIKRIKIDRGYSPVQLKKI